MFGLVLLSNTAFASFDIPLDSIDDTQHQLSEYIGKGKWVVLNIWGTECPPCREEMPELVEFHDNHKDSDSMVVSIAIDFPSYLHANKQEVAGFADDYLIDFPVLLSDGSITRRMGLGRLDGLPSTYVFDPEGKVIGVQVGAITRDILETFINNQKLEVQPK
jgi:thiol-disulfide isomerase/thioredoxin